jgi:hypothetical protein
LGKVRIPQTVTTLQSGAAVPLSDVTVSWERDPHFMGETGPCPVTIRGAELGAVLDWMARVRPGEPTRLPGPESIGMVLEGLARICNGLHDSSEAISDAGSIFWTLGVILDDYAARLAAYGEDGKMQQPSATVAIAPPAASTAVA